MFFFFFHIIFFPSYLLILMDIIFSCEMMYYMFVIGISSSIRSPVLSIDLSMCTAYRLTEKKDWLSCGFQRHFSAIWLDESFWVTLSNWEKKNELIDLIENVTFNGEAVAVANILDCFSLNYLLIFYFSFASLIKKINHVNCRKFLKWSKLAFMILCLLWLLLF